MEKGALIGVGRTADIHAWGNDCILKLYQDWMPAAPIEREFAITPARPGGWLARPGLRRNCKS
jgi:hypothetical protein